MASWKDKYRDVRQGRPLGFGGFAEVFEVEAKSDPGTYLALKRPLISEIARLRLKREIDVQLRLQHRNVMPILDADPDSGWFVMPKAVGNLEGSLKSGGLIPGHDVQSSTLALALIDATYGLEVAHDQQLVHRDISPGNLLYLDAPFWSGGARWVVSDWGLVRRPMGLTTTALTRTGAVGTEGFAAPETWRDAHRVGPAADIYSLGRIALWALTGEWPIPNVPGLPGTPNENWDMFVLETTSPDPAARPNSMDSVRALIAEVFDDTQTGETITAIIDGLNKNLIDVRQLTRALTGRGKDERLYFDDLPQLERSAIKRWVVSDPGSAAAVAQDTAKLLQVGNWGDRDYNYANTVLLFCLEIIKELADSKKLHEFTIALPSFFEAEVSWNRFATTPIVAEWIASLRGPVARITARALRANENAITHYRGDRPRRGAIDPAISEILGW